MLGRLSLAGMSVWPDVQASAAGLDVQAAHDVQVVCQGLDVHDWPNVQAYAASPEVKGSLLGLDVRGQPSLPGHACLQLCAG
eukprot:m.115537 g.115537  ORF g.115537 m.115537 type:complete len:82 (-) comp15497_c0_seq1:1264-1509(-)